MWLCMSMSYYTGHRFDFHASGYNSMCVEAVLYPLMEQEPNITFGCYGCRAATDVGEDMMFMGVPTDKLPVVVEGCTELAKKGYPALSHEDLRAAHHVRFRRPTAAGTARRVRPSAAPDLRAMPEACVPKYAAPSASHESRAPQAPSLTDCANRGGNKGVGASVHQPARRNIGAFVHVAPGAQGRPAHAGHVRGARGHGRHSLRGGRHGGGEPGGRRGWASCASCRARRPTAPRRRT